MNIVLCGDSYYDFDERYPGLHWADRLSPHNVYRLARGCATNFSIMHQVQHTPYFSPDLVLISFTSIGRVEFNKDTYSSIELSSIDENIDKQWLYRNTMYSNVDHANAGYNRNKYLNWMPYYIEEFETIKNSLFIKSSLDFLAERNIPYLFTLGGFAGDIDINTHQVYNILPNGWEHNQKLMDPYFHITDPEWHSNHAEFINGKLAGLKKAE